MNWLLSLSIRKLMMILIVIMTVVSFGTLCYSALKQRQHDLREAESTVRRLVNEISNDHNALLAGTEQLFSVLSQLPAVQMHEKNSVNKLLAELANKNPQYANILIADKSGRLWASAVPAKGTISYADRRYFKAALASGSFSSGEYSISRTLHKPIMSYAAPIKDHAGNITDVAIVAFTLEKYGKLIKTRTLPENTSLLLTDHKGTILFVPTAPQLVGKQDREDLLRSMSTESDEGTFEAESNVGIRRIYAYRKLRLEGEQAPYLYVRAGIPVEAVLAKTRTAMIINVGLMSAILLLLLVFAIYISKKGILDKIIALRDASNKIAAGDFDVRVAEHVSGGELGELGRAFDEMANKLAEDILKLKRADEALSEREERLRVIFDTSQAGMILVNSRGFITFANQRMAEMFGYSLEELSSMKYPQLVHPDEQSTGDNRMRQLIAGEIDRVHNERLYRRKNGTSFWGYLSGRRHDHIDGSLLSLVGVIVDISEIKQSQELLKKSEERYRSIIELAADTILLGDAAGNFIGANESAIELTGYTLEELLRMNIANLFTEEELSRVPFRYDLLKEGHTVRNERIMTRKNGSHIPIEMNTKMMPDGSYQAFVRDMSEHRRRLDELIKVQKLESLGILAGGIAHDFNNILTGIMGNIFYARNCLESHHEAYEPLVRAEKASQRAANLARQLLIFAKGGQPVKKVFSVRHIIHETISLVLSGTKVKGIIELPQSIHALEADEGQLSQSLHNIVINAVQAMPDGGTLTVRGENAFLGDDNGLGLARGDYVKLTFADDGCGISAADLKMIFDPYFTTKSVGTGLGLASTYAIISSHGGKIFVQSSPGKGTTFTIYLPSVPEKYPDQTGVEEPAAATRESGSILVMDDEEMVRELALLTLGRLGYTVTTCINGNEAIALYKSAREAGLTYAVVIMDLTIPGSMGGVETARIIHAYDPDATLVVSSGYSEDPVMANYEEYGFCAAIEKPYRADDISRVISSLKNKHPLS